MAGLSQFTQEVSNLSTALQAGDERAREAIIACCFSLIQQLETPSEMYVRLFWSSPSACAAMRTAVDLNLFMHLNDEMKSSSELAEATSSDQALLIRILRLLASVGVVNEAGNDAWTATPMSKAMIEQIFSDSVRFCSDVFTLGQIKTPEHLRKRQYHNPTDILDTAFTEAFDAQGKENAFQIWQRLGCLHQLGSMMKVRALNRVHWSDEKRGFYPLDGRLLKHARNGENEIFLVDIGGGTGIDLLNLLKLHPSIPGHLVLQDLPEVINNVAQGSLPQVIQPMAHDFFCAQPVKGARTYFMHQIMHDWPSQSAKIILQHIAAAMEKGYSKLIIWDQIMPDVGCPPLFAGLDWLVMMLLAGQERTESAWRTLIEDDEIQPRLKVTGFWYYSKNDQGIVEAELA